MRISYAYLVAAGLTAISAALALWAWTALPPGAGVPFHVYALDGLRRTETSRALVWLLPAVSTIVTLAFLAGSRRPGVERAAKPYETTLIAVVGVLLVTEYALTGRAFDPAFNVLRPVSAATGLLLVVVGNLLGKARQNAVFGLRTPWTLGDASVWDKTHRFTGRAMFAGGGVLVVLSFILGDGPALGAAIAACAAIPPLAGIAYSASLYRSQA
jgi:hypothetical protein